MTKLYTLKELTDIWTGDADRDPNRLITTGLLGSIRWWFEVLARGLGGRACDPTVDNFRCPDTKKKPDEPGHHCVVCELFGCTGWARKFRFDVLDENDQPKQIKKDETFKLRFTELRPIRDEEWALLDLTLLLIVNYGAIGGRTVFKPTNESGRETRLHHRDFGLIDIQGNSNATATVSYKDLEEYLARGQFRKPDHFYLDNQGRRHDFSWASLDNFWCVKGRYLARQSSSISSYNFVIERPEPKHQSCQGDSWRAGRRPNRQQQPPIEPESKKIFSFKEPEEARRTFGFVQNDQEFPLILEKLKTLRNGNGSVRQPDSAWQNFDPEREFLKRGRILEQLFRQEEGA